MSHCSPWTSRARDLQSDERTYHLVCPECPSWGVEWGGWPSRTHPRAVGTRNLGWTQILYPPGLPSICFIGGAQYRSIGQDTVWPSQLISLYGGRGDSTLHPRWACYD